MLCLSYLLCVNDLFPQLDGSPSRKWRDKSRGKRKTVSTLRWWSVAADWCASFQEIHGQIANRRRNCLYFAMMICRCWWISALQGHFATDRELKEKLFVLCDDDLLLLMDLRPSRTFRDRSRTEGETVCTLRWWSVAADGSPSFKDISGQVQNRRRNCFYFQLLICCRWSISVLQGHLGTSREVIVKDRWGGFSQN